MYTKRDWVVFFHSHTHTFKVHVTHAIDRVLTTVMFQAKQIYNVLVNVNLRRKRIALLRPVG